MSTLATLAVTSPYSGQVVGEAPVTDRFEVAEALDAAARAGAPPPRHERARVLNTLADRLVQESAEWARLITLESGLCLKDTLHEVGRAVDVFRFAAMEALRDDGETFAGDVSERGRDRRAHTLRVPVSVVAAITPFNHPLNQVAHKVAPAIAAGAPIVLKPSERTP
ncbi:MAG TPA: aldehyde dehydrogenase family protein, partial [Solirubrobacteraceae bacterium]|nr:aldehyde dehydrogenase family protein [Solirubrobacteraceae bacterium]